MNESKKQTIAAFARLVVSLVLVGATMFGISVDAGTVEMVVGLVVSAISMVYLLWWKNQNVTDAATEAQEILDFIKNNGDIELDETIEELSNGKGDDEDEQQ